MMASGNCTPERLALEEKNDDGVGSHISRPSPIHPLSHDKPIVTRWELWSYYFKRL